MDYADRIINRIILIQRPKKKRMIQLSKKHQNNVPIFLEHASYLINAINT